MRKKITKAIAVWVKSKSFYKYDKVLEVILTGS